MKKIRNIIIAGLLSVGAAGAAVSDATPAHAAWQCIQGNNATSGWVSCVGSNNPGLYRFRSVVRCTNGATVYGPWKSLLAPSPSQATCPTWSFVSSVWPQLD